jgi:hypothetical protein
MTRLLAAGLLAIGIGVGWVALTKDDEAEPPASAVPVAEAIRWAEQSVLVSRPVVVRNRPNGRVLSTVGERTEFGSPEVLSPTGEQRGSWIAVSHTSLGNGGTGWVDLHTSALDVAARPLRLEVDLSRRELVVRGSAGPPRRISVAIGAPDTPTPPGDFYVTDKLRGADFGAVYGCCILALSGRQPNLPQGWSGGDRLAIHGSPTPTWGQNVSNGCLHASTADLQWLMQTVPLGTVVAIRN